MSPRPGTRIGPYEVGDVIGTGGMGEVFRARDTRLGRAAALKMLPPEFALDGDRRARFEREARILAALNHPHIAQVYGLEDAPGAEGAGVTLALAMELVEGEDLASRIARGPVPLDEALPLARQLAEGLEAAHHAGIVHRDLKPANIRVTPNGVVKVLDFGLAKPADVATAGAPATHSPTLTSPALTTAGVVLGTASYMAPEQARGRPVDRRADIWAFGCVLYELLTGQRAFAGEDVPEILGAILKTEPDWSRLPPDVSASLRACLVRCLHKDVTQRIPDLAVMRMALEGAFDGPAPARPAAHTRSRRVATAAGAALVLAAAIGLAAIAGRTPAPTAARAAGRAVVRFEISPPGTLGGGPNRRVAISPDGTAIAHSGLGQLNRRLLNAASFEAIRGTEGGSLGAFSPDGQSLAFVVGSELKRVAVAGGAPVTLCAVEGASVAGIAWQQSQIVYAEANRGVFVVPDTGGTPRLIVAADTAGGELVHGPRLLPGGRAFVYSSRPRTATRWDAADIVLYSLDTNSRRTLIQGGTDVRYLEAGFLVFARDGSLYAQRFDAGRQEVSGTPVTVADGVQRTGTQDSGHAQFDVSDTGTLVYQPAAPARRLVWRSRDGQETPITSTARPFVRPRLSPDGTRIAVADEVQSDVWLIDADSGATTRLTSGGSGGLDPTWLDDRRLLFSNARGVFSIRVDAPGAVEQVGPAGAGAITSVAPDGRRVLMQVGPDIGLLDLVDGSVSMLIDEPELQAGPIVSPDGRWLAYYHDEAGVAEVSVRPFPDISGVRRRISRSGGASPVWLGGGRELLYSNAGQIFSAILAPSPGLAVRGVEPRFGGPIPAPGVGRHFDPTADGTRVVTLRFEKPPNAAIGVVVNWLEEVRAKLASP